MNISDAPAEDRWLTWPERVRRLEREEAEEEAAWAERDAQRNEARESLRSDPSRLIDWQRRLNATDAEQRRLGPHGGRLAIYRDVWEGEPLLRGRLDMHATGRSAEWWCPLNEVNAPHYTPINLPLLIEAMWQAIDHPAGGEA